MPTAIETQSVDWTKTNDKQRTGLLYSKELASGNRVGGINFWYSMVRYSTGEQAWEVPAHRHVFDQIRFAIEGDANYAGKKDIPEGWCAYFPAGAHYGPQHNDGGTVLLMQFGELFLTNEKVEQATAELQKRGNFHEGIYTYHDEKGQKHNRDGMEAIYQHIFQRKIDYPKPQYREPILINPEAFGWISSGNAAWHKAMGTFGDRDLRLSMLRWEKDGIHELPTDRTQLVFTLRGKVEMEGKSYSARSGIVSEIGTPTQVRGLEEAEAFCVSLPLAKPSSFQ